MAEHRLPGPPTSVLFVRVRVSVYVRVLVAVHVHVLVGVLVHVIVLVLVLVRVFVSVSVFVVVDVVVTVRVRVLVCVPVPVSVCVHVDVVVSVIVYVCADAPVDVYVLVDVAVNVVVNVTVAVIVYAFVCVLVIVDVHVNVIERSLSVTTFQLTVDLHSYVGHPYWPEMEQPPPDQVRTMLRVSAWTTDARPDDAHVWERYAVVTAGTGAKLSNQRALRRNLFVGANPPDGEPTKPVTATGTITLDPEMVKPDVLANALVWAGQWVGIGASRKMGWGRFTVVGFDEEQA